MDCNNTARILAISLLYVKELELDLPDGCIAFAAVRREELNEP